MDAKTSMSDARRGRAFYLPATAAVRRFQRAVSSAVRDRARRGHEAPEPSREFYLPAMAVVSAVPGRVERFVTARVRNHAVVTRAAAAGERIREFYLPATLRR